jgi:hypothetical protein
MSGLQIASRVARPVADRSLGLFALAVMASSIPARAQTALPPGNLVVSRSVYNGAANSVTVGETLPPGCVPSTKNKVTCGTAAVDGTFPYVFNNDVPDGSFGITSPIYIDEMTPSGAVIPSIEAPNSSTTSGDQLVTSFGSKSEEALHLSTDGPTNTGGLQKRISNATTQQWQLAYKLKAGLNLGIPYTVSGYPTGLNNGTDGTGLPWSPATDGMRNIIGTVQGNRIQGYNVHRWAISSAVSGDGDQGADPNKMYLITDRLANTSAALAAEEHFTELRDTVGGEVLRGVRLRLERR